METTQQLKSDYLEAMGIKPWFPRAVLVNSLPPLQLTDDLDGAGTAVPHQMHSVQPQEAIKPEPPVALASKPAASMEEVRQSGYEQQVETQSKQTAQQVRPVRFGLGLYVFGDWLVASSLVHDHALYQDQAISLASNIIKAIEAESLALEYHHVISWPFFTNANADQGAEAARQYVSGVIDHLKENHNTHKLLAFGGVLPKLQAGR